MKEEWKLSTRSFIAKQTGADEYLTVYCHSDGYLTYNGALLLDCYNTPEQVDELAAFTALLADNMRGDAALASSVGDLNRILSRLMSVEALLATGQSGSDKVAPLDPETVAWLEGRIDAMQEVLKPIDKFTIPGGNAVVSMCHVCRTVCRRAERAALRADARYGVDSTALVWLNRLSDYFYLLGRTLTAHYAVDEVLWIP